MNKQISAFKNMTRLLTNRTLKRNQLTRTRYARETVPMKSFHAAVLGIAVLVGCNRTDTKPTEQTTQFQLVKQPNRAVSLVEARKGFKTKLPPNRSAKEQVPEPPPELFRTVRYDSPVGKLAAYLSVDPNDGKKHPAIIWLTGGDCNSIGDVWTDAPASNDQTAAAFRKAGIMMMNPALRGGNDNPGVKEGFLGEVDDVLAAADFLAKQAFVDPSRIYLGGHSTGGTLVLLVAECSDRFRAVFSFGPVGRVAGYGPEYLPFDTTSARELELRDPIRWLHAIKSPVFVVEGENSPGNVNALREMEQASSNPQVRFLAVSGAEHFSILTRRPSSSPGSWSPTMGRRPIWRSRRRN